MTTRQTRQTSQPPQPTPLQPTRPLAPAADERFLSEAACQALAKQVAAMAVGGGHTQTGLGSNWTSHVRWARNRIATAGDVRNTNVTVLREIRGASATVQLNMLDPTALEAAVRRSERLLQLMPETTSSVWEVEYTEQYLKPTIWSDATYHLEAEAQAEVVRRLIQQVEQAGLTAAGYLEVAAHGSAVLNTRGRAMYYPSTSVQYTLTVRDPQGTGSGWAGVNHWDWTKIDAQALTHRAIEKCLASRHPVALEPGRYTTILEPQAVYQLTAGIIGRDRSMYELKDPVPPFGKGGSLRGQSRIGEVVVDERLTLETDPMDPELAYGPFGSDGTVYHATQWIHHGVLTNLPYDLRYAMEYLGKNAGLPSPGAYRLKSSAPPVSLEEMIASTPRGLLVSHVDAGGTGGAGYPANADALGASGYTRDGVWLIEQGKRGKPVQNFKFEENPYSLLQPARLEQIGAPERVYTASGWPVVVPPLKVKDFNFTQLADAV